MNIRKTTEQFIEDAQRVHGDTYDYSKANYVTNKTKIIIICKGHGEFQQLPTSHLSGTRCKKCFENMKKYTTEKFIQESKIIHGDKYDYSKAIYVTNKTKVIITCNQHGEFLQLAGCHLNGNGCKKCAYDILSQQRKGTTIEFIENSKEIHGDTYDYSKTTYTNSKADVTIICKIHGDFEQNASNHLKGNGCKKCAEKLRGEKQTCSNTEFLEKIIKVHGDKYDYSKTDYINCRTNITIICKIHGEFLQLPSHHLNGSGCKKCSNSGENKKYTTCEFLEKTKMIHGDKYDYSKTNYTDTNTDVIIICKIHGEFTQKAKGHLSGYGCKKCGILTSANKQRSNKEDFIKKAIEIHGNKFDYSKVEYIDVDTHITIICKKHGDFEQTPYCHITKDICCRKCCGNYKYTSEEFIEKLKDTRGDTYNYNKVEYINSKNNIIIECKKHGDFLQYPGNHLQGAGCPFCINKTETILYEKLKLHYPSVVLQFKQEWCKNIKCLPYDLCIPEDKIIIELDGAQHFRQISNWQTPEKQFETDKYKETCANNNNYSVIRLLQEDVLYDTYDWMSKLCDAIEEIKESTEIINIYLCQHNEYANY